MLSICDLLFDDCIQYIIQLLDIQTVIYLSETNIKMNTLCNKFESIKNHIINLPFNPFNFFPYYENNAEKNIKKYINYDNHNIKPLLKETKESTNNKFVGTIKHYSTNIIAWNKKISYLIENGNHKNLIFTIKIDKIITEPIFSQYEFTIGGSDVNIIHYDELPILYKHFDVKNTINNYTLKNGIYKYKIPIVIGLKKLPNDINTCINITMGNSINTIHHAYIKSDKYFREKKYGENDKYFGNKKINKSYPFIITKNNSKFNFVNGINDILIKPSIYPIKLYFYFNNIDNIEHPFKTLQLSFEDIIINYKYEHIKKEFYNNTYKYCLNFIDNSINIFDNIGQITKCKIKESINVKFNGCNANINTNVIFYTLCYNNIVFMRNLAGLVYSN